MLTIELDRCDGCGNCVEVCPEGAISLVSGVARIDSGSCTECEVCVQACPSGAIRVARPIAVRREPAAAVAETRRPEPVEGRRPGTLATLVGATVSFIGSQLLPRAADAIVNALDRRLSEKPAAESGEATPTTTKPGGRRHRRRGGRE
jgi:NAD-dependent dihydropyrimidine dehydrogenase PreA subunit